MRRCSELEEFFDAMFVVHYIQNCPFRIKLMSTMFLYGVADLVLRTTAGSATDFVAAWRNLALIPAVIDGFSRYGNFTASTIPSTLAIRNTLFRSNNNTIPSILGPASPVLAESIFDAYALPANTTLAQINQLVQFIFHALPPIQIEPRTSTNAIFLNNHALDVVLENCSFH
jgi:hypothetical protein